MAVQFGKHVCYDPRALLTYSLRQNLPVHQWYGKANSFRCPLGSLSGQGWILLTGQQIGQLDYSQLYDLTFADARKKTTLKNLLPVTSFCVTPGAPGAPTSIHVVELADKRRLWHAIPIDRAYNLRSSSSSAQGFFPTTLNTSATPPVPWTWDAMLADIWDTIDSLRLGDWPGLGFDPDGVPDSYQFWQTSALEALAFVLRKFNRTLKLDLLDDSVSIVELGGDDGGDVDKADKQWSDIRVWDEAPQDSVRAYVPERIRVLFRVQPFTPGLSPWYAIDVGYADPNAAEKLGDPDLAHHVTIKPGKNDKTTVFHADEVKNTEPGSVSIIQDDLPCLFDSDGNVGNLAAMKVRATERAINYFNFLLDGNARRHLIYRGVPDPGKLKNAPVMPTPQIQAVSVEDRGNGPTLEVFSGPIAEIPQSWDAPPEVEQSTPDQNYYRNLGRAFPPIGNAGDFFPHRESWHIAGFPAEAIQNPGAAQIPGKTLIAVPFISPRGGSIDRLALAIGSFLGTPKMRLGIYSAKSNASLYPSKLLFDSGTTFRSDPNSGVFNAVACSIAFLPDRLYWFVVHMDQMYNGHFSFLRTTCPPIFGYYAYPYGQAGLAPNPTLNLNRYVKINGPGIYCALGSFGPLPNTFPGDKTRWTFWPPIYGGIAEIFNQVNPLGVEFVEPGISYAFPVIACRYAG